MIPDLTPAEIERLALLMEEMGEVAQAIGKILRHGYESRHLDGGSTNRESLEREIGHVRSAVSRLIRSDDVFHLSIIESEERKEKSVKQYLHHQKGD